MAYSKKINDEFNENIIDLGVIQTQEYFVNLSEYTAFLLKLIKKHTILFFFLYCQTNSPHKFSTTGRPHSCFVRPMRN